MYTSPLMPVLHTVPPPRLSKEHTGVLVSCVSAPVTGCYHHPLLGNVHNVAAATPDLADGGSLTNSVSDLVSQLPQTTTTDSQDPVI